MAIVQAKAPNSGRYYNIEIAGTTPTPEEKIKIDEYIASVDGPPTGELIESDEGRGFFGALGAGVDTVQMLYGSALEGLGESTGIDSIKDIGTGIVETNKQDLQESGANATRLEDVKDIGSGLDFFVETLGEQLPNLATTVAGSVAGGKAGAAIGTALGPGGAVIGGAVGTVAGGLAANIPFFFGGNREAQKQADIDAGRTVEVDNRVALLASIPQASLDLIADRLLVGRFLTPKMIRGGGLFSRGIKGVGVGAVVEAPTEVGQQLIERLQAGQSITSEEAMNEYIEVAVAAGLVGGTVKGTVGVVGGDIIKQEKAEATRQLQEDAIEEGSRADARIKAGKVGFDLRQPIEEEAEPEVVAEVSDTNLTDAQKNLSLANAAKQATRPFIPMPLSSFPPEAADYIRQSRQGTSIPLDADVTKEELAKVFNQDVADLAERVQKPDLAAKPASPIFSVKQKEDAKKEIQKRGKVNKGQIKRAIKTDSTEVVDEILRDLETDGVVKHLERGRYVLPEDKRLDPLYKEKEQRDKARAEITRIEALKQEAIRLRDKALEENNPVAAEALNREIENIEATVEQPNTLLAEAEDRIRAKEDAEKAAADERLAKTEREEAEEASKLAMQAESARYRDEYQTKRKKVAARLRQYMRSLGLGDVGLKIDDYIEREGGLKDPNIEGVFDPSKRSISLAMSIYDPSVTDDELYVSLRNVLNHEIIHAIKEIGLFTDAEYKTLVKAATNTKYVAIKQGKGEKRAYTFLDRAIMLNPKDQNLSEAEMQALLEEEAIAEMFRAYADGRLKIVGKPKNLLDRIVKFFKALGGAHFDEGFDSAASIFENIQTQDKTKQLGTRKRGQFTPPKSNAKYSTAGIVAGYIEPDRGNIERINQSFKDVTKRIDEMTEAAKKLVNNEIDYETYDRLVNDVKPIMPYKTVPAPATIEEMRDGLQANQLEKLNQSSSIPEGTEVQLRLDIPAYRDKGVWVPTIHGTNATAPLGFKRNQVIAHESVAIVNNADLLMREGLQRAGLRIAAGAAKGPYATITGSLEQTTPDAAFVEAQRALNDPSYVQVGFDPFRHSYFYDRMTTQPVIGADRVIQVGPLVLAKNPVFAPKKDFLYSTQKSTIEPFKSTPERVKANVAKSQLGITQKLAQASVLHRIDENNNFIDTRVFNEKGKVVAPRVATSLRILQEERGNITLDPLDPKDFKKIVMIMAAEAEAALRGDKNAIGWYEDKVATMFEFMGKIEGGNQQILNDPDARAAFTFAMAVTSNGLSVNQNFVSAMEEYKVWKETGLFKADGYGDKGAAAMRKAFNFYNTLKSDLNMTDVQIQKYLTQETTVRELKKDPLIQELGIQVPSGELQDTKVRVAHVLGAKIGNGFYMNLNGEFDALTMDMWWMRMWNRIIGKPFKQPTDETNNKNRKRIQESLEGDLTEFEQRLVDETMLDEGLDSVEGQNVDQFATALNAKFQRIFTRFGKAEADKRPEKTPLFQAADTHAQNLSGKFEQATPRNGTEREVMRAAAESSRELLKEKTGIDINNADFQALMWYHEKRLLASMGTQSTGADNDYVDGAIAYARREGFTDDQIAEALPPTDRDRVYPDSGARRPDEGISRESAENDTAANLKYSLSPAKAAAIAVRIGAGDNGRVWRRKRSSREVGQYDVAAEYKVAPYAARLFNEQGVKTPAIFELAQTMRSAQQFAEAIDRAKIAQGPLGSSVYVYPVETTADETGYADMRLFLTRDGKAGFALKEGEIDGLVDIVSVFNTPDAHKGFSYPAIRLAVDEGGNKLDAFDTFLPGAYSANGFTIRSRTAWNDEFAPEGWDKEEYSDFNNGEPDVVFMYYNPKRRFTYKNGDQEGELFLDYDDAVDAQNGAALNPSSVNRQLDINRAETIQLFENEEATLGEITPEQEQDLRSIMDMMESLPKSTRKFSTAPSNAFATINAPKRFPRFEKYNSLFGIMKENNNLIPVMFFAGNHGVDSSGRAFGFGKYHIQERGHEKEIVENSKFPDVETAVQQLMFAWHKQGHKDGPNVVSFPDGGGGPAVSDAFIPMGKRDLRLEWLRPSHSSPKIVLSLQYGRLQDPEVLSQFGFKNPIGIYSVRTTYPDLKAKKLSRSFSRSTFANVDTGSTNFVANHNNNHISYSAAHNTISKILGLGGLVSEQKARDVSQSFITKFQDTFLPVGVMIDKLKQQGMTITDGMDTYLQETLFHGKTGDILNSKQKEMYEPLARLVKDLEVSDADFSRLTGRGFNSDFEGGNYAAKSFKETGSKRLAIVDAYLYALHAKERNAYIRSINNDLANGSGMTDAEADYILSWVASLDSGNKQIIADVQQRVRQVVDDTNAIRVASGLTPDFNSSEPLVLESGEIVQPPQYENYVPLRGIFDSDGEATEDASYTSPVTSQGYSVRGREDRRALGRQEYATNILAATFLQNQNAVIRSERNKVGLSFLNLLRADERLTSQFAEELESVPLTRGLVKGAVRTIVDRNALNDPNIITVKEDGKHVYIRVRDQRLANALKGGAGVSAQTSNAVVRGLGKINRYLSNINTSLNPEFMITNMIRDVQTAGVNINQYEQKGLVSEVRRNFLDALSAVKQVVREDANIVDDPSIPVSELTGAALFRRFQRAGGQNATNQISDLSDQVANIKKLTDDIAEQGLKGQWNAVKNSFVGKKTGSMLKFLEDYNTVIENGVRVATFKALAPRIGEQRAAFAARNVTVDFAKGGEYKTLMNSMYLFYNASLQGSFAMLSAAARSKKVRKIWVGLMVAGVLQDQLLAFTSGEDEDGQLMADKIPDYILEHNLVFRDPFGITERSHIVIPMPYGLNMAVNIGRSLSRASRGGYTPAEAADSAMMTMIDTLNPLGGTESFINFVMPTVVDPIIDLYENEDFANKPIYKETSPFDPTPPPDSQLYWSTTSPSAKWIAQWLNSLDGSTVEKGTLDVSPDVIEFWVDYLTGGVGRFVQMSGDFAFSTLPKAVEDGFTDEMIRQVPFGRKVVYSVSEREDLGSFIEKRDRVLQARAVLTDAIRRGDADLIQNTRSKYKDELRIAGIIKSINNGRNSLLRRMAQIKDNPRIPEEQKKKIIERMSKQVDALILRGNIIMQTL